MSHPKAYLFVFATALLVAFAPASALAADEAPTNTNECIADLGGIQVCQETGWFGLPADLHGCCDGVRQLARDRCECNPALDLLLGEEGQQIYQLEPLCRLVQPARWLKIWPRVFRSCGSLQTDDYGCEVPDMDLDAARLSAILEFSSIFQGIDNEAICLDTPAFVERLTNVFEPDIAVTVPYGIGTYTGVEDVAEYLGMAFAGLNHGYWLYDGSIDPTGPARLDVSPDGADWAQGSTQTGSLLRGAYPYRAYLEQLAHFEGCQTRISTYNVAPTDGMRDLIETYVQTSDLSRRWGVEDICRYHTAFCAPDPETKQFDSEEECLDYIGGLPLYTEACGPNRPLSGHSLPCKFKHHFMIPTNPKLHCPHIGPLGAVDPNAHFKCDDQVECSSDQGQASWPPVENVGANTPEGLIDLYEDSNAGWESEPFGCAVPTAEGDHSHTP